METKRPLEGTIVLRENGKQYVVPVHNGEGLMPKARVQRRSTRAKSRGKVQALPLVIKLGGAKMDAPEYGPSAMTARLVNALGNNAVAALLGVNKDRPNRWASGKDVPNEENRIQLADLDALVGHLLSAFTPAQAILWLEGQNPHLNARPIDVYRLEGAAPVIEAIRAHEQGAFA
ncbi:hypothetical protein AB0284_20285 [Pseudarthrobacter phenanthrenivorans]|uniref:hypothetical protein n=1 Tax=Pseudarthrobacter phenanthrenivorans TaxID=361575 RepID=UPI00344CA709